MMGLKRIRMVLINMVGWTMYSALIFFLYLQKTQQYWSLTTNEVCTLSLSLTTASLTSCQTLDRHLEASLERACSRWSDHDGSRWGYNHSPHTYQESASNTCTQIHHTKSKLEFILDTKTNRRHLLLYLWISCQLLKLQVLFIHFRVWHLL